MDKLLGSCPVCKKDIYAGEGHYKYGEVCYCSQECLKRRKVVETEECE